MIEKDWHPSMGTDPPLDIYTNCVHCGLKLDKVATEADDWIVHLECVNDFLDYVDHIANRMSLSSGTDCE